MDKLYSELRHESLANRKFYIMLIAFYKIVNKKAPQNLIIYQLKIWLLLMLEEDLQFTF